MQWKSGFLVVCLPIFTAGCQRDLPPPTPPPHQGVTLRVVCPPALAELIDVQSRPWRSRQQARVEAVPLEPGKSPADIQNADIWLLPSAEMPRWAAASKLHPVPVHLTRPKAAYNWDGLLPYYRNQLLAWGKVQQAVPILGEAPVCIYREDLLAEAKRRPPVNWDEFATLAEFLRDHHPSGKPTPSLPPLPADDAALDRLFYTIAASYARRAVRLDEPVGPDHEADVFSFHYDLKTGKPLIASPGFVAALELLTRLQACRPKGRHERPEEAFLTGQAVLGITNATTLLSVQKTPELRDKMGATTIPGSSRYFDPRGKPKSPPQGLNRVPYLGGAGWLGVVPKMANKPEAAWDLLADLTGPARSALTVLEPRWGGGPYRVDQLLRERWDAFDLDAKRTQALKEAVSRTLWQHGIKNPVLCLRIPDQLAHRDRLVAGLERVLLKKGDPAQVLQEVAREWVELDERKGRGAALADYRLSVGLLKE